jgi:hypothetical protein
LSAWVRLIPAFGKENVHITATIILSSLELSWGGDHGRGGEEKREEHYD